MPAPARIPEFFYAPGAPSSRPPWSARVPRAVLCVPRKTVLTPPSATMERRRPVGIQKQVLSPQCTVLRSERPLFQPIGPIGPIRPITSSPQKVARSVP
ncbi:hypothetical protein EI77_04319 [Prosthecobacter fusiformis]|uniref:Uncharacterized protein n=1 Tax=Prosthecobacter fusiformis TaxID=48464 RepID=A0A4R7RKI5_9BACT|nr:hypothetical protein EI77_04319 [Prosthecobacter fusiformis]